MCEYKHWSAEEKKLVTCDCEPAGKRIHYDGNVGREYELCAFHLVFVDDATGTFSKRKGQHPADYDWLKKAKTAYGIKACNLGSAFPYGMPSSAGPKVNIWGTA